MIGADIYTYIILIFIFALIMGGFIMILDKRDKDDDEQ